jgi:hypothetical protein
MASFYTDEHVPFRLVDALRALGHDVLTAREDGRANQGIDDPDVLARATGLGRAVITNNRRDYHRLHRRIPNHAGIVTYTDDPDRAAIAGRIDAAVAASPSLAGRLVKVIRPNPPRSGRRP